MPTFCKIPISVKQTGSIAGSGYAVFCKGLLKASEVIVRLEKYDSGGGLPAYGYLIHKKEKIYYCRYGFVNDPATYSY